MKKRRREGHVDRVRRLAEWTTNLISNCGVKPEDAYKFISTVYKKDIGKIAETDAYLKFINTYKGNQ